VEPKERSIHLVSTGAGLGVEVVLNPNPPFLSNLPFDAYAQDDRVVFNGYRATNADYYIGLHELGHVYLMHPMEGSEGAKRYDEDILEGESEAWLWAFENAREDMSEMTKEFIASDFALGSYARSSSGPRGKNYWKVMLQIAKRMEYATD
jgi:hypothetical protein